MRPRNGKKFSPTSEGRGRFKCEVDLTREGANSSYSITQVRPSNCPRVARLEFGTLVREVTANPPEMQHYAWIVEPRGRPKSLWQCGSNRQNATEQPFCCTLEDPHQRGLGSFRSLTIARADVLHGGGYGPMPECLSDESQIDVASHKVRRQRMLKHMGVPFFG